MSQELIYTSAPKGLKPGTRGFCTVASTQQMPAPLAERLESLSGYRHLFAPNEAQAHLNPVIYSHLILTIGGRKHHVLSRVADAGLDYTQRSNKFAHHVVLDASELPRGGPAWLMTQPGFLESTWDGEPKLLPSGRRAPDGLAPPAICHAWQALTGDAGWAGVLAETASGASPRPACLLFRPGQDLLPLVAEALALLPIDRRWQVTFSTWFTKLPPGVDCQWRFLLADSPEVKAAQRQQHALVIDLTAPLPAAGSSPLVVAARTGVVTAQAQSAVPAVPPPQAPASVGPPIAHHTPPTSSAVEYGLSPLPLVAALRARLSADAKHSRWLFHDARRSYIRDVVCSNRGARGEQCRCFVWHLLSQRAVHLGASWSVPRGAFSASPGRRRDQPRSGTKPPLIGGDAKSPDTTCLDRTFGYVILLCQHSDLRAVQYPDRTRRCCPHPAM